MDYLRPQTVAEALAAIAQAGGTATVIAGGTDIIGDIKFRGLKPTALININRLEGLRYITEDASGLRIGALTNIQELVGNPIIAKSYTALGDAAERFASLQVRNLATVAGSLGRASPGGDMAPPLMALGASVIAVSASVAGRMAERWVNNCRTDFCGAMPVAAHTWLRMIRSAELLMKPATTGRGT